MSGCKIFLRGTLIDFNRILTISLVLILAVESLFSQSTSRITQEIFAKKQGTDQLLSPGFDNEIFWTSTYANGKVYIGTAPNAHIYEVDPYPDSGFSPIAQIDLGSVGYQQVYGRKDIYALTSDSSYVYGGTSHTPFLFYFNPALPSPLIVAFGNSQLKDAGIKNLWDATIYNKNSQEKYIYFGTVTTGNLKIVKWIVRNPFEDNSNNDESSHWIPNQKIIILDYPSISFIQAYDVEIGKFNDLDVLYVGAYKDEMNKIFVIDLSTNQIINESELPPNSYFAQNFKADKFNDGYIWLFSEKISKYNLQTNSIVSEITPSTNYWKNWNDRDNFPYLNEYIYTADVRINTQTFPDSNSIVPYSPQEKAQLTGFYGKTMAVAPSINRIFTGYSWGNGKKNLFELITDSQFLPCYHKPINENELTKVSPSGGGYISGLAVSDHNIISSIYLSAIRLDRTYQKNEWLISNINCPLPFDAVQSDKIIVYGDYIIFGMYNRPYLRIESRSDPDYHRGVDLSVLYGMEPTNGKVSQGRIYSMVMTDNGTLVMGTGTSNITNLTSRLICMEFEELINTSTKYPDPKPFTDAVGKLDNGIFLSSLSFKSSPFGDRIYGIADNRYFFIKDIPLNFSDNKNIETIETYYELDPIERFPTSVLYHNGFIYIAECHNLNIIPDDKLKQTFDMNYTLGRNESYFRPWCGQFIHQPWVKNITLGNDGLLYAHYDGSLISFNSSDPLTTKEVYKVPGFDDNNINLAITCISIDYTDNSNDNIYMGTEGGKLFENVIK